MAIIRRALSGLGVLAALLIAVPTHAASIQIDIDTASLGLGGQNWDLAFDFIDANPQSNSVTISSFAISGGSLTGAATYYPIAGNVTGDLSIAPGTVTLNDYSPASPSLFNEYLHNANLGASITFAFEITGNQDSGLDPDTFSFFFIDPVTGLPFDTPDPTGALFVYSIGNDNQPALYCPRDIECVTATPIPDVLGVPEPGALALAIAGLLALGVVRSARKLSLRRVATA
jgi:hypothetical protein